MSKVSEIAPALGAAAAPFEQSTNNAPTELQGMHHCYNLNGRN